MRWLHWGTLKHSPTQRETHTPHTTLLMSIERQVQQKPIQKLAPCEESLPPTLTHTHTHTGGWTLTYRGPHSIHHFPSSIDLFPPPSLSLCPSFTAVSIHIHLSSPSSVHPPFTLLLLSTLSPSFFSLFHLSYAPPSPLSFSISFILSFSTTVSCPRSFQPCTHAKTLTGGRLAISFTITGMLLDKSLQANSGITGPSLGS